MLNTLGKLLSHVFMTPGMRKWEMFGCIQRGFGFFRDPLYFFFASTYWGLYKMADIMQTFSTDFLEKSVYIRIQISLTVQVNIDSSDGLVPNWCQSSTWTNVDPDLGLDMASLGHNDWYIKIYCSVQAFLYFQCVRKISNVNPVGVLWSQKFGCLVFFIVCELREIND